jgi:hypothetical protein
MQYRGGQREDATWDNLSKFKRKKEFHQRPTSKVPKTIK